MILDQGIGAHHAQVDYLGMGWAWTWVSGEALSVATITGQWANVITVPGNLSRIECKGNEARIEAAGNRERVTL